MGILQKIKRDPILKKRVIAIFAAHVIMGFSIDLLRFSLFGNDPFSCMQLGFSNFFNASYGTCVIIFNLFAIIPIFIIDRSFIQFGTLVNMLLTGPVVDAWYVIMLAIYPDFAFLTFGGRVACLLIGVVICCYGVSLYMMSNLGMGPYDAIAWIIDKISKKKFPFKYARIATDATATFIGFIFGSIVGIGTLIIACGTGPIVNFFNENFTRPMIYKR